jgi:hypothetical protein
MTWTAVSQNASSGTGHAAAPEVGTSVGETVVEGSPVAVGDGSASEAHADRRRPATRALAPRIPLLRGPGRRRIVPDGPVAV